MIALLECFAFPLVVSRAILSVYTHSSLHASSHPPSVAPHQRRHRQWVYRHFTNVSRARIQSRDQTHDCQCLWPSLSAGRVTELCGVPRGWYACLPLLFFSNACISYREAEVCLWMLLLSLAGQASAVISSDSCVHSLALTCMFGFFFFYLVFF